MDTKPSLNSNFAAEVVEELKRVTWPTKKETTRLTLVVILISLIVGFYIGIIDIFLAKGLELMTKFR